MEAGINILPNLLRSVMDRVSRPRAQCASRTARPQGDFQGVIGDFHSNRIPRRARLRLKNRGLDEKDNYKNN